MKLSDLLALISFLTTIPTRRHRVEDACRAFALVPLIGALEGVLISVSLYIFKYYTVQYLDLFAVIAVVLHVIVTGAMHLDGYADYIDGIGSRKRGEELLKVLKDPRKGSFAVVGICINLLLSFASFKLLLTTYTGYTLIAIVTLIYVLSTETMYIVAMLGVPEPYLGLAREFVYVAKLRHSIVKNIVCLSVMLSIMVILGLDPYLVATSTISMIVISILIERDSRKRLGFVNGDVLGFSYEVSRLVLLVISTGIFTGFQQC